MPALEYPSGHIVEYERDANGNINAVGTRESASDPYIGLVWWTSYLPFGTRTGIGHANGLVDWRAFDSDGDLNSLNLVDATDLIERSYGYYGRNLVSITDELDANKSESYWYTPRGSLQNADGPWGELIFYVDAAGNRTYRVHSQGTSVTTDAYGIPGWNNRVVNVVTDRVATRTFTHDDAGNIVADVGAVRAAVRIP